MASTDSNFIAAAFQPADTSAPASIGSFPTGQDHMSRIGAFASYVPSNDLVPTIEGYQSRKFRAFAKEAEDATQFQTLAQLLQTIGDNVEDLNTNPDYVRQLQDWKNHYDSLITRVDQVKQPPSDAPDCKFKYPVWTHEQVSQYLVDNGIPHGEQVPALVGGCFRDRRPSKPATVNREPAVAEVFEVRAGTRDPANQGALLDPVRGCLPKNDRGPYPEIIYDAPLINNKGNDIKEERKCYMFTAEDDNSTTKTLNMVSTLQSFVFYANNNGYTEELNKNFLRSLLTRKDPTAFRPFKDKTAQEIVDQLIRSYYVPPPDDETQRLHTFVRRVGDNIQTTYSQLENILQCHFNWLPDDKKRDKIQDELSKCILLLIHPLLSQEINTERAYQIKSFQKQSDIRVELQYIQKAESSNPAFQLKHDLPLNARIDGLQLTITAPTTVFNMNSELSSFVTEKRSREQMETESRAMNNPIIRTYPRRSQTPMPEPDHKRSRSTPPPVLGSMHTPRPLPSSVVKPDSKPPFFFPTGQRPPTPQPPAQSMGTTTPSASHPPTRSPVRFQEPIRGRTQSPEAGFKTPGGTRRWLSPRGRTRYSQSPDGNIRKYAQGSRSFIKNFDPHKDSLVQPMPKSQNWTPPSWAHQQDAGYQQNRTWRPPPLYQPPPQQPYQSAWSSGFPSRPDTQQYGSGFRPRSRSLSREGRRFRFRDNIPTDSDITWILNNMDRNNFNYWTSKDCDQCHTRGHGSVICPTQTCPKCSQVGVHRTVDHCTLVRHKIATTLLTTKRLDRINRSPSPSPYREMNRTTGTRYADEQRTGSPATQVPRSFNIQIPDDQIQMLAKHLTHGLRLAPDKKGADTDVSKN